MVAPFLETETQGLAQFSIDRVNTWIQGCQTFNQLRGLVGVLGMTVYASGGFTPNDGLQGMFQWSSATGFADNGSTVIKPFDVGAQGAWLRVAPSGVSLSMAVLLSTGVEQFLGAGGIYGCLTTEGPFALRLPPSGPSMPSIIRIYDLENDAGVNNIVVTPSVGDEIFAYAASLSSYAINLSNTVNDFIAVTGGWRAIHYAG